MPQRDQHSASDAVSQVISSPEQDWNELVEQRLPADVEAQARALGAFQRVRGVSSARVLLRAVLCYVLSLSSLKELSGWSRLVGVTTQVLASQSWHERLQKCGPMAPVALPAVLGLTAVGTVAAHPAAHPVGRCHPSRGETVR